jgi:hypothetical protein
VGWSGVLRYDAVCVLTEARCGCLLAGCTNPVAAPRPLTMPQLRRFTSSRHPRPVFKVFQSFPMACTDPHPLIMLRMPACARVLPSYSPVTTVTEELSGRSKHLYTTLALGDLGFRGIDRSTAQRNIPSIFLESSCHDDGPQANAPVCLCNHCIDNIYNLHIFLYINLLYSVKFACELQGCACECVCVYVCVRSITHVFNLHSHHVHKFYFENVNFSSLSSNLDV